MVFACRITLVSESSLYHFSSSRILQSDDSEGPAIVLLYTLLYPAFTFLVTFPHVSLENSLFGLIYGNDRVG